MVPYPSYFIGQVNKYLPDQCRIFNTGDDLDGTAVFSANTCLLEGPLVAALCDPWPVCKDGGDGSGDTVAFSETCKNLKQWVVTGNWTTSRGECSAKNTDSEHFMHYAGYISSGPVRQPPRCPGCAFSL